MHKKFIRTSAALVASSLAALILVSNGAGAMMEELEKFEIRIRTAPNLSVSDINIDNGGNKSAKWRNNNKDEYSCFSGQFTHKQQIYTTSAKASYKEIRADNYGPVVIESHSKCFTTFELIMPPRAKGCITFLPEKGTSVLEETKTLGIVSVNTSQKLPIPPLKLDYPQGIQKLVDTKINYSIEMLENAVVVSVYSGWARDK